MFAMCARYTQYNLFDSDGRDVKFILQLGVNGFVGHVTCNQFVKTSEDGFVSPLSEFIVSFHKDKCFKMLVNVKILRVRAKDRKVSLILL